MQPVRKVRSVPRISLNSLAEFLTASETRKRSIIADQHKPKTAIVARYRDAEPAVIQYLESRCKDASVLTKVIDHLDSLKPTDARKAERVQSCLAAVKSMRGFEWTTPAIANAIPRRPHDSAPPLLMAGVQISVRPDLLLFRTFSDRKPIGAVKLRFSKTCALGGETAAYVGAGLCRFMVDAYGVDLDTAVKNTVVLDVFSRTEHLPPRSITSRLKSMAIACEQIVREWPVADPEVDPQLT